ncbi:hypothetical protein [Streptomyces sp. NPDC047130]|uniref:hypothetical protein n=1 Tax=Streptomyces sp. NPDC047130 TaxID=3155261 RepID=UPI0033FBD6F6
MALCFGLVVNFGDDIEEAQAAALVDPVPWALRAGPHRIPLHRPMLRKVGRHVELSLLPEGVGWGCSMDGSIPRIQLGAAELTELAHQLYGLLRQFRGYLAAKVGWVPEELVDHDELRSEWSDQVKAGGLYGLVLCDELHAEFDPDADYEVFQPGYRWVPYRGEQPSDLPAGR